MPSRPRSMGGFSLLELMVAIVVAAILAAIAVPSFRTSIQRHRLLAAADELQAAVQYARTEAVLRATYVSLCPSADGTSCASSTTWDTGWLVYSHPVATSKASDAYSATPASGMQILRAAAALTLVSARGVDTGVVTFGQQGQLEAVASRTNAGQPVAFVLCAMPAGRPGSGLGENSTRLPGTRIGVSPYGGIASTKLTGTDSCMP
ncbi:GspH/FimT family pseudopilin [Dyella sp. 333MFSha]|uniref:GspH/FimT family pseudopilin n=1 Tax=Dyella sp. 333MFSha TaxID=1798240 RepID=UPI000891445C|nr:GspH/FimT family pseudopilin [Dyella sp. 333MFSha]SDF49123.1 type IV fimbrial biogenesis protein FimT [Dyella sp. 333MFSha]